MTTYTVKQTISLSSIQDLFKAYGRGDNFSYEGLQAIMDYLEDSSIDEIVDLDVIAICCEFTEAHADDIIEDYSNLFSADSYEGYDEFIQELQDYTFAVKLDNGNILYANF